MTDIIANVELSQTIIEAGVQQINAPTGPDQEPGIFYVRNDGDNGAEPR
jgi:hypothetical protein